MNSRLNHESRAISKKKTRSCDTVQGRRPEPNIFSSQYRHYVRNIMAERKSVIWRLPFGHGKIIVDYLEKGWEQGANHESLLDWSKQSSSIIPLQL